MPLTTNTWHHYSGVLVYLFRERGGAKIKVSEGLHCGHQHSQTLFLHENFVIKFAKVARPVPKTPLEHKIKDGECDDADAEKD